MSLPLDLVGQMYRAHHVTQGDPESVKHSDNQLVNELMDFYVYIITWDSHSLALRKTNKQQPCFLYSTLPQQKH